MWRWRQDRSASPKWVADVLPDLIQSKVAEAHLAQTDPGISSLSRPTARQALGLLRRALIAG